MAKVIQKSKRARIAKEEEEQSIHYWRKDVHMGGENWPTRFPGLFKASLMCYWCRNRQIEQ